MRKKVPFIMPLVFLCLLFSGPAGKVFADVPDQLKQAAAYKDNRRYQQAEAIYQQIITAFPDTNDALEAQKQLALIYTATNRQQQADAAFEKLVADYSKHKGISEAVWQIAKGYEESQKYDKAFELYQYNVEHFRNDVHAVLSQVEIVKYHFRKGDDAAVDAAVNNFLTAFSGQPTLPKGIYHIARRYDEFKRYDKAIKLHQYNVEHFPGDIHAMWSQVEIIYTHLRNGDNAAADAAAGNLLTAFSKQPTLPKEIWQVASKYDEFKRYDKAFELNKYNIEHFRNDVHAVLSQVEIVKYHFRKGDDAAVDAAVNNFLTAFSGQPTLPKGIYHIARRYDEFKRYDKAIQLHQYNVEHFPEDIYAMWSQVEIIKSDIRDANDVAADAAFNKLLTVFSGQPTLPKEVYQIADAYNKAGRNDKARQLYQKAGQFYQSVIDKNPNSNDELWAKAGMAKSNISLGNDAAVQADVNNLIADFNDNPDLPQAIFQIGEEYYNKALNAKGDPNAPKARPEEYYRKTIAVWERIIQELPSSPTTPQAYWCSAVVYSQELDKYQKGIEYYQHIVDTWPYYEYAWSAQFLIGRCYQRLRDTGVMSELEADPYIEHAYQAVIGNYSGSNAAAQAALELARWNFKKARWLDAAEYFELFIDKDQGKTAALIPGALYDLGQAYEKAGFPDQAAEAYKKLVDIARPDDSYVRAAKARLMKLEGGTKQ